MAKRPGMGVQGARRTSERRGGDGRRTMLMAAVPRQVRTAPIHPDSACAEDTRQRCGSFSAGCSHERGGSEADAREYR
jgi:hypothetical protein